MGRLRTRAAAGILILAMGAGAVACAGTAAPAPASSSQEPAEIVIIGNRDFAVDDAVFELGDLGYAVGTGADEVTASTDLVILAISGVDGPMASARDAVAELVGLEIPRVAIGITRNDMQPDDELRALVVLETRELLASYGITPVDGDNPVLWPGDVQTVIERHLARPAMNYRPVAPVTPTPAPLPPTATVQHFAGVPLSDAIELLAEIGLVGEPIADPDFGVVSDCDPQVQDQAPVSGSVLPTGSTVGLLVPAPDEVDPAMAGCLLPEWTRAEVDARVAELESFVLP